MKKMDHKWPPTILFSLTTAHFPSLLRFIDHTPGSIPLDQLVSPAAANGTQNKHRIRRLIPSVEFQPKIPAIKRWQTNALDLVKAGICACQPDNI